VNRGGFAPARHHPTLGRQTDHAILTLAIRSPLILLISGTSSAFATRRTRSPGAAKSQCVTEPHRPAHNRHRVRSPTWWTPPWRLRRRDGPRLPLCVAARVAALGTTGFGAPTWTARRRVSGGAVTVSSPSPRFQAHRPSLPWRMRCSSERVGATNPTADRRRSHHRPVRSTTNEPCWSPSLTITAYFAGRIRRPS